MVCLCYSKCVLDSSSVLFHCHIFLSIRFHFTFKWEILKWLFMGWVWIPDSDSDIRIWIFVFGSVSPRVWLCSCLLISVFTIRSFMLYPPNLKQILHEQIFFAWFFPFFIFLPCLFRVSSCIFLCTLSSIIMIIISFCHLSGNCVWVEIMQYMVVLYVYVCVSECRWALCTPYFIAYVCC